jgi:alpha-mannosidase
MEAHGTTVAITALKRNRQDQQIVLRGYNLADQATAFHVQKEQATLCLLNLLEEEQASSVNEQLHPYEIRTIGVKE